MFCEWRVCPWVLRRRFNYIQLEVQIGGPHSGLWLLSFERYELGDAVKCFSLTETRFDRRIIAARILARNAQYSALDP